MQTCYVLTGGGPGRTSVMNWKASIAFALLFVTARMYTSLARMYRKEQEPRTRTGVRLDTLSPSRALMMCDRNAVARLRLRQRTPAAPAVSVTSPLVARWD